MRIAILAALLVLLLTPSLRSGAAAPIATTLRPTPAYPQAGGTVQLSLQSGRPVLTFDLRGLPRPQAGRAAPVYVAWLADGERRLYNLGTLMPDEGGAALSTFTPYAAPKGELTVAISAESRADVVAPANPRDAVLLSAQLGTPPAPPARGIDAELGPGWFAPIIPATLGLILLRHAARSRRAELRARRLPTPVTAL